jgi:hypothetical protein
VKIAAGDRVHRRSIDRSHGGRARNAPQQRDLAERLAGSELGDAVANHADLDSPAADDQVRVAHDNYFQLVNAFDPDTMGSGS